MKKLCVRPAKSKDDLCIKEEESSVSSLLLSLTQDLQSMIYAKLPLQDLYKLQTCCWELYDVIHHDSFKHAAQVVAKSSCDLVRSSSANYSHMFFSVGHDGVLECAGSDVTASKWSTFTFIESSSISRSWASEGVSDCRRWWTPLHQCGQSLFGSSSTSSSQACDLQPIDPTN